MSWIIEIIVTTLVVMGLSQNLPSIKVNGWGDALLVGVLVGLLNPTVGWLLTGLFNVLTLGVPAMIGLGFLIRFLAMGLVIKLVDVILPGFKLDGIIPAFIVAGAVAVAGTVLGFIF